MTDKVQLIKQELERLKDCASPIVVCDTLLNLIDSLPKESGCEVNCTTKNEDLEEEIDKCWEGWIDQNPEVKIVAGYLSKDEFSTYARHFAEWQEKKMLGIAEAFYQQGRHEQEQEMMKDAVEAEVMYPASSSTLQIRYKLPKNTKLKYGDKVKIIIVKTKQP